MSAPLVFVTGGSSGIGRALIETLPWPGARALSLSRRPAAGAEHVAVDLATPAGWERAAACFERELARFDGELAVLVQAAGTLTPIRFAGDGALDPYRANVLLNSAAPQILGDAFLRALPASRARGWLLCIGSGASRSVYEGWSGYCAGKAATDHWVRTAGAEQARRGDRCRLLCVAPGVVATPMQAEIRATPLGDFPERERFEALHRE
ncbi:MAG TPA: SDR family NAD(P)-dependent oxidoreductase, partial [Myxococcota bacterium]|nr:SDR family NAD(P)-dependent oxidoreductase [Myxococcota bacterium]